MDEHGTPLTNAPGEHRRQVLRVVLTALSAGIAGCPVAGAPDDCDPSHPPPDGFEILDNDSTERTATVGIVRDWLVTAATVFWRTFDSADS